MEAEAGLDEDQKMMLRASAYDCYDMLVMCDEFHNQARMQSGEASMDSVACGSEPKHT